MDFDSLAVTMLRTFAWLSLAGFLLFGAYLITSGPASIAQNYSVAFALLAGLAGLFSFALLTTIASIAESLIAIRENTAIKDED